MLFLLQWVANVVVGVTVEIVEIVICCIVVCVCFVCLFVSHLFNQRIDNLFSLWAASIPLHWQLVTVHFFLVYIC